MANLVPARDFANAVAWNSSAWQTATIVGPVAGGLLYGLSAETAYSMAGAFMLAASLLILILPRTTQAATGEKVGLDTIFAGFRYIWGQKVVLGAISLDLFAVLLSGAVALLPVYARDILELGPWGLGLLRAAPGVGAIAVAVWLAGHPLRDHAGRIMFVFVALFGVATVIFGLSTLTWLSILALALIGATDMISVYVRETLIPAVDPGRGAWPRQCREHGLRRSVHELGEFRAGMMAALIGTVPAVVAGGVGAVAVAGLWAWLFPELRRIRHSTEEAERSARMLRAALAAARARLATAGRSKIVSRELNQPAAQVHVPDQPPAEMIAAGWAPGSSKRWAARTTQRCIMARVSSPWNWMPQALRP